MQKFNYTDLPHLIKQFRKIKKMSQNELARALRISRKSLSQYEHDASKMQLELFSRMLDLMGQNGEFEIILLLHREELEFKTSA